jgi:predicted ATPase
VALLGPIEVDDAGGPVPVAGAKLQALLALLALAAPSPVSDDRLLEELWGDDQPAKPANALQAQVSHLRRILGREQVTRHGSGYTLAVPPDDIDVTRLERLVHDGCAAESEGDHRRAVELLGEAVALVRGEPLAGLADHAFARHAAARLGQLLLDAHEALADAELATGRHVAVVGRLPVPEISTRLDDRFRLLRTSQRGGESRHQGLGAAIDWSYELLFDDECRAFRQLAVFVGGANVDAVEATCGPDALELATRLIDRSLLVADTSGRQARFRMLESLRAYGMERLAEEGETQSAADAHLRWCLDLAERVDHEARGADQLDWLIRLDAEHDNVRAALAHGLASDVATGMQLVGALITPWWFRGRRREARQWVDAFLDAKGASSAAARARVLSWQTLLLDSRGRPGGVEREVFGSEVRVKEAVALASTTDDDSLLAYARAMLALTLARRAMFGLRQGEEPQMAELLTSARGTFERQADEFGLALVSIVGIIDAVTKEDVGRATVLCEGAVARAARHPDRFARGRLAWFEGMLAESAGDPVAAYRHVERGVRLLDELGMGPEVTTHGALLARLAETNGEPELAAQWKAFVLERAGTWGHDDTVISRPLEQAGPGSTGGRGPRRGPRDAREGAVLVPRTQAVRRHRFQRVVPRLPAGRDGRAGGRGLAPRRSPRGRRRVRRPVGPGPGAGRGR